MPRAIAAPRQRALGLTWRALERRAQRCPYLGVAVRRVWSGDYTREEAMLWATIALSHELEAVSRNRRLWMRAARRNQCLAG